MMISPEKKTYLLNLKKENINSELIFDLLANKTNKGDGKFTVIPAKYKTSDTFYLEKNEYFNTEKVLTNVGLFLYNKIIIEGGLEKIVGYVNTPIDNDVHSVIERKLSNALKDDIITVDTFVNYLNTIQWLSMQFNTVLASSFTLESITPNKKVIAERDRLIKSNKDRLDRGDIKAAVDIDNALVDMAKKELKGDPGMELYDSKARGKFGNAYKNMHIMKGAVYAQGKWEVITHNYSEGLEKKDLPMYANAMIAGQYPKSIGTQVAGYLFKKITAGFQAVTADKKGSDCGTKHVVELVLTKKMRTELIDRYIVENGKYVLLSEDVIDKYIGKTIKLRSPLFCNGGQHKCNICLGEIYYKLGIENVGLATAKLASTILNLNMKKFHDATPHLYDIDLNDISI